MANEPQKTKTELARENGTAMYKSFYGKVDVVLDFISVMVAIVYVIGLLHGKW